MTEKTICKDKDTKWTMTSGWPKKRQRNWVKRKCLLTCKHYFLERKSYLYQVVSKRLKHKHLGNTWDHKKVSLVFLSPSLKSNWSVLRLIRFTLPPVSSRSSQSPSSHWPTPPKAATHWSISGGGVGGNVHFHRDSWSPRLSEGYYVSTQRKGH
jgi:hypothetical protein